LVRLRLKAGYSWEVAEIKKKSSLYGDEVQARKIAEKDNKKLGQFMGTLGIRRSYIGGLLFQRGARDKG